MMREETGDRRQEKQAPDGINSIRGFSKVALRPMLLKQAGTILASDS